MSKVLDVDITKLPWPLNMALAGAVFSIFALIYNLYYIYYGFLTFLCGIICRFIGATYDFWLKDKDDNKDWRQRRLVIILQAISMVLWIISLIAIYTRQS